MATNRPRGFAAWKPQARTQPLLNAIQEVLLTYRDNLPLTGRQIFYRLVGTAGYDKTEASYKRLLETLNRARRADLISMDAIRDDGATTVTAGCFKSAKSFIYSCRYAAEGFRLDLLQFQPQHVEVLCEAAGMVPQLSKVAKDYGVTVRSSGGFDSTTVKHQLGKEYGEMGKPVVVLHVGDHDPSGEHIYLNLADDVGAFTRHYGGEMTLHRVAVTPAQQQEFHLPTAPPKASDRRSFESAFTVQAEALPPDTLAALVRQAIESQIDLDIHLEALHRQGEIRQQLMEALAIDLL
jgi:hypothetical protein